jgi:hypothetical protein
MIELSDSSDKTSLKHGFVIFESIFNDISKV